jgi:hypothetical protein
MTDAGQSIIVVNPLLPECVNGHLSLEDVNAADAQAFRPDEYSYYKGVLTSIVPGIVLGCISAIVMIGVIIWTCKSFCRCCCATRRKRKEDQESEQFIVHKSSSMPGTSSTAPNGLYMNNASMYSHTAPMQQSSGKDMYRDVENNEMVDAHFGLPKNVTCMEKFKVKKLLKVSIIIFMLATVGVSAWGIAASIDHTDSLVSGFWDVYGNVQDISSQVYSALLQLGQIVQESEPALADLMANENQLLALTNVPALAGASSIIKSVVDSLGTIKGMLYDLEGPISTATEVANSTFIQGLQGFRNSTEPPTLAFEDYGRFIAIAVIFGVVILFSILASVCCVWCRFPRIAATSVILLWFFVALLMFLGVGLLKGVNYVTEDGCLYAETFVVNYAANYIDSPVAKGYALRTINYYVNPEPPGPYVSGEALGQIVDPLAGDLLNIYTSSNISSILQSSSQLVTSAAGSLSSSLQSDINTLASNIPKLDKLLLQIDQISSRSNIFNTYYKTKEYICCALSSDLSDLFDAWVATGCLALVLATLCTWQLVWFVRTHYEYR